MRKKELGKDQVAWKNMSAKQRFFYLWDYYKWPALIAIVLTILAFNIIRHIIVYANPKLQVVTVNEDQRHPASMLIDTYVSDEAIPEGDVTVTSIDIGKKENGEGYGSQKSLTLLAMLSARTADCIIITPDEFESFSQFGYFKDLSKVVGDEYSKYLIEVTIDDSVKTEEYSAGQVIKAGIALADLIGETDDEYLNKCILAMRLETDELHDNEFNKLISYLDKKK